MSDSKIKGIKDLIWGAGIFVCIAALVVAFFFCAVTRNGFDRDARDFSFSNEKTVAVQAGTDGLDAMSAESGDLTVESTNADISSEEDSAQYFNAAEYWSAIANGSNGADAQSNPDGLDA